MVRIYVTDWFYRDESDPNAPPVPDYYYDDDSFSEEQLKNMEENWIEGHKRLVIWAFGLDERGRHVQVRVTGFTPFYHVEIPAEWSSMQRQKLKGEIPKRLNNGIRDALVRTEYLKARSLYYFTGDEYSQFLTLYFSNTYAHRKSSYMFINPLKLRGLPEHQFTIYESKIDPIMRLIHVQGLSSVGWLEIPEEEASVVKDGYSVNFRKLSKVEATDIPPIVYAAFDIEADSSHGDFPIAVKDYDKLARDIASHIQNYGTPTREQLEVWLPLVFHPHYYNPNIRSFSQEQVKQIDVDSVTEDIVEQIMTDIDVLKSEKDLTSLLAEAILNEEFTVSQMARNLRLEIERMERTKNRSWTNSPCETLRLLISLFFTPEYDNPDINRIFIQKGGEPPERELLKALAVKIDPIVKEASTIYRQKRNDKILLKNTPSHRMKGVKEKLAQRDHNDRMKGKYYSYNEKDPLETYISMLKEIFNQHLPPVQGDPVIQIGTTIKRYGEPDCYLKHIVTLKGCEPVSNQELVADEHKDVQLTKFDIMKALELKPEEYGNQLEEHGYEELNRRSLEINYRKQLESDRADVIIESYEEESEVLLAWTRLIQQENPDIITGYNIYGYDFAFMYDRAKQLGIENKFVKLARVPNEGQLKEHQISSSAMGDKKQYYLDMPGRILIDMQDVSRAQLRLDNYKLDNVCRVVLNKSKNDLPPDQIFVRQKGTDYDRYVIAKYCLIDCVLCNRLMDKLEIILNQIGLAQVCSVPLSYIFLRGQGIRTLSLTARECRQHRLLIPTLGKDDDDTSYEGAIVLDPNVGIYSQPVSVADFSSLYPSCMISENLSHDSFVSKLDISLEDKAENYRNCQLEPSNPYERKLMSGAYPDWSYVDIVYDTYSYLDPPKDSRKKKKIKTKTGQRICRFAQPPNGGKSTLPNILIFLLKQRKKMKKTRDQYPKGSFSYNLYEGLQLAYKVVANSMYGQLGSKTGPIRFKDVASCVTATGRSLIQFTRDYVLKNYEGAEIIYGDSVTADTPVLIKNKENAAERIPISNLMSLGEEYRWHGDKWAVDLDYRKIKAWSDRGWTGVKRVIKHWTDKDIYRVSTHYSQVEVTADHSLLVRSGRRTVKQRPVDLEIGDILVTGDIFDSGVVTGIERVEPVETSRNGQYVYDLQTVNHHFQAGKGYIVVHNTDSVFGLWPTRDRYGNQLTGLDAINKSIELCTEASKAITSLLKPPHELEFEKAIYPFTLATRKKYHGHYYTEYGKNMYTVKSMGIVLKRRDNAPIVKKVYSNLIGVFMNFGTTGQALQALKEDINKILQGQYPAEDFILSKTLAGYYADPDKIAHNVLAQRIGRRDPGNKPQSNDRIAYIHIVNPDGVLQGDKIETPEYIAEHGLQIDYDYYIMNAIKNPVVQILDLVMDNASKYYDSIVKDFKIEASNQVRLTQMSRVAYRQLLREKGLTPEYFQRELGESVESYLKRHNIRSVFNPLWQKIQKIADTHGLP